MAVTTAGGFDLRRLASQSLAAPLIVIVLLAMMVVPLPSIALDLMFTLNITLSIVVVLAVVYVMRPLDFSLFPTVLLVATLFRLALNVASTRVVLMRGHEGPDAAGHVIEAFGNFVVGGDYAVGLMVFLILTLINFVVITKGAGRVSEVTARFTLDAMPGRQMAIDADLNAGLLTREEAKQRREEVREEADFYGAMDGASKFVRGDAIAGLLILLINVVGGIIIGTNSRGMGLADAASQQAWIPARVSRALHGGLTSAMPQPLIRPRRCSGGNRTRRSSQLSGSRPSRSGRASGVVDRPSITGYQIA